jgi:hypothetical protein
MLLKSQLLSMLPKSWRNERVHNGTEIQTSFQQTAEARRPYENERVHNGTEI